MSRAQRLATVRHLAATGLPIVAGVPAQGIDETLRELSDLAEAGADTALITPPGYYPISDAEIVGLLERLAESSSLPLVLYHIPGMAGAGYTPQVVAHLAGHPMIAGLKDSSRDLQYLRSAVRATDGTNFTIVTGTDALLIESLQLGAAGTLAASPNVAPGLAVGIWTAYQAADLAEARRLQDRLHDLVRACRAAPFPSGWKHAASVTGAIGNDMVPPGRPVDDVTAAAIELAMKDLGLAHT